ncbi:MAG TPA: endolytic transglycosylase MltG [Bacteroidia bacterium]|nr:endolytic transglycosylase MltG [Bacteroidia bacterium]QQR94408.1 MAG: endolytic transglycosylase MltG [Bacteroidota bacterium]MBP7713996.1 endolytic transglycosylase MltG [Bacteroidia bacterium]MBP8667731.1 endolytic transglycosylase MltG [Bacteroidia bacterium]HOZ82593.1 endolytic transglycosylase MltG [Bacteroidia bacterium]
MKKILFLILTLLLLAGAFVAYIFYQRVFAPNVKIKDNKSFLYIRTGSNFNQVVDELTSQQILINAESFKWLAEKMNYTERVIPGRYEITDNMNNRQLLQLLRSGKQVPIKLTFNNIRTKSDLASRISHQIEADSLQLIGMLNDSVLLKSESLNSENVLCLFIPNTYEMYWNTDAADFFKRMKKEYDNFWTEIRKQKAAKQELTPVQVSILASIVQSETKQNAEKPRVAGVYLNRLRQNWKLEADPTLVFALGDFSIKRVLNEYKTIDSPYNTYKYFGLPPGPICLPDISSIDAVLNAESHQYMYFCAREDMSGFHAFAKDYNTHLLNARRYQAELNRRNIRN